VTVRLVATDIDGTLLRSDSTVSPRTRAALRAAEEAGLVIAFVTGRPPRWLDVLIEETGHVGVAVAANGAVLYDLAAERVVALHSISAALMIELGADLRDAFPAVQFAVEFGDGFAAEPGYVHDWEINPELDRHGNPIPAPRVGGLATVADRPAVKLLAKDRGVDVDEFLAAAARLVGERASVTHSSSFGLLEISAPGITKATGLAELAVSHGITADEVLAIGDMPNDVPMLEWAGRSYAVANAHPSVLEVADEVVGSNDEDAVAILLEGLLG
jgi:hypothetical protein